MDNRMEPNLPPFPSGLVLSSEFRLAVACSWIANESHVRLQNETVADICEAGEDWEAFLALVDRHGIPVQALTVLRRCLGHEMPETLCRELKIRSKRNAVRSFVQASELIRLNRLLREHAIDMLPLKGVALSQRLYGAPDVRTSGDIDVLIRPENLATVDRLLADIGYRNIDNLTERQMSASLIRDHHANYYCERSGQHLELHWENHFWSRDDMDFFWQSQQPVLLLEQPIDFSNDLALFLSLCDHGARHRWMRLKWLGDIAMMLAESGRCDWDAVPMLAERLGMSRVVAQGALLVHWLYGLSLPTPIANLAAEKKSTSRLAKKAIVAMFRSRITGSPLVMGLLPAGIERALYYKQIRPTISWGRLLKELFICPTDYKTFPLPDCLFWLYVPARPVFWFWRHYGGKFFSGSDRNIGRSNIVTK